MIRPLSRLFVVLIALAISGVRLQRASAAGEVITGTCSSITLSGTATGGTPSVIIFVSSGGTLLGGGGVPTAPGGAYSGTITFPAQPTGTVLTISTIGDPPPPTYSYTTTFTCGVALGTSAPGAVTFFNPGDGRVDPRPGDRLAVWCNTAASPPTIGVYGVQNDSRGIFLATLNVPDLLKAKHLHKALGSLGQLDAVALDANGNFLVAWTGGPFGATGQGNWAKAFRCSFPR